MHSVGEARDEVDSVCDSGVVLSNATSHSIIRQSDDTPTCSRLACTDDDVNAPASGDDAVAMTTADELRRQQHFLQLLNVDDDGDTYVIRKKLCQPSADILCGRPPDI